MVVLPLLGCSLYLFRQDRTTYDAAIWIRNSAAPNDLVTLRVNHRIDINDYPEFPVFSYYAKRGTWIDTSRSSEAQREHAFATSDWAVMTLPPVTATWAEKVRDKIRRYVPLQRIPDWPRPQFGFEEVKSDDRFSIYRKKAPAAKRADGTETLSSSQHALLETPPPSH
jgi:hypothetical protein